MAAVNGITRSIERDPYDELCGLLRGGKGLLEGVYGIDMLTDDVGVWDRDGAVLIVTIDIDERLYRGRVCRPDVSAIAVVDWNWRRYLDASESRLSLSSLERVLPSNDASEGAQEDRCDGAAVGERGATMSRMGRSSKEKFENGVGGGVCSNE